MFTIILNIIVNRSIWFIDSFGWVSLFNDISTFMGYLMSKSSFFEEQQWYYLSWENKEIHTFLKGISPKVNVIAQLDVELAYFKAVGQLFSRYSTETSPP